ncbi:MAG: ABC transporter substrate-binding protein [Dehalococcoidia bacterium]|nr:ABC transporter substrate-binding protein [Dehalococcoidia bacterium]
MQDNYWTKLRRGSVTRRRFLAGSATAAAGSAAILAGCGDDDDNGGKTSTAAPSGSASASATQAAGKRGGTVRLVKSVPDVGVDPAVTATYALHTSKVYSHTHLYQASTGKVLLDMALSYEQVDATTLNFKLRPGIKFAPDVANGREVTSADLAYSWSRYPEALKSLGSQFNKINWGWMDVGNGAKFETPDPLTVTIKQNNPFASNLIAMGNCNFAVVAKEAVEGSSDKTLRKVDNAGSGPYRMVKHESTGTRFERNPNYYRHENPAPTFVADGPYVDAWEERIIADPGAAKAAFLSGEVDILSTALVPIDKIVAEDLKKQSGVKVLEGESTDHLVIAFDAVKWTDPRLRQAISLGWDRDKFIRTVYVGDGLLGGPVSPCFKDLAFSQAKLKEYQKYDPAQAKKLWDEAGGAQKFGGKLKITANAGIPVMGQAAQFIGEDLKKSLGVDVQVDIVDGNTYVAKAVAPVKEWDLFVAYHLAVNTMPDYNALTLYVPSGFGGIFPNMRLDSSNADVAAMAKEIETLYQAQARELDKAARKTKMDALQEYLLKNNATSLPLPIQKTVYQPIRDKVKNFPVNDWMWGAGSADGVRVHNLYLDG